MDHIYRNNKRKPWVYIAGPYTQGDPVQNTRAAIRVADSIVDYGVVPIVPHLTMTWDLTHPRPPLFWYEYTLDLLKRCDAIFRLPGPSTGADYEVKYSQENGIVYLEQKLDLLRWCHEHGVRENKAELTPTQKLVINALFGETR